MQRSEVESAERRPWVEREGVMTGTLTGDRLMVIPAKFMVNAKEFLRKAYGDSVRLVLNRLAREIGLSYGNLWKENGLAPSDSLRLLADTAQGAGWGGLGIEGDPEGKKLTLTVTNCAFCTAESQGADGKCDFMGGFAEGIAKATYGREHRCDLVQSSLEPVRKCVLSLTEASDQRKENWKTGAYFPWLIETQ